MSIIRRKSTRIYIGKIPIGDGAPISVQSMTNTKTIDTSATIQQINELKRAGADIIRISVPTMNDAEAFKFIKKHSSVPLIADVHFNYRIAIKVIEYGADCLRINPGTIGKIDQIRSIIECARDKNIPIRIGINAGSLEKEFRGKYKQPIPEVLVESAMKNIDIFDKFNFSTFKVSIKSSDVFTTVQSYRLLAPKIDQPLHLGITESGGARSGTVKSAIGIGILLSEGIGDTLRVSLAEHPKEEVRVAFDILRSLNIRSKGINFIACPTCARQEFDVINSVKTLEDNLEDVTVPINVSIIGCSINGHGEALNATIGVVGKKKKSIFYDEGIRQEEHLDNNCLIEQLEQKIRNKAKTLINNCNNINSRKDNNRDS